VAPYVGINTLILSILSKVIGFIKIIDESESRGVLKMFERGQYNQ
jgi:hypothetical protein